MLLSGSAAVPQDPSDTVRYLMLLLGSAAVPQDPSDTCQIPCSTVWICCSTQGSLETMSDTSCYCLDLLQYPMIPRDTVRYLMLLLGSTAVPKDPSEIVGLCCSTPGSLRHLSDTLFYCLDLLQYHRVPLDYVRYLVLLLGSAAVPQDPSDTVRYLMLLWGSAAVPQDPSDTVRYLVLLSGSAAVPQDPSDTCQIPRAAVRICCSTPGSLRHLSDILCCCQALLQYPRILQTLVRYLMLLSGSAAVPQDPSDSQIPRATVGICCNTPGSLRHLSDTLCCWRALLQYPRIPQTVRYLVLLSGSAAVPQDPSDSQIPHATVRICYSTPGSLRHCQIPCATVGICCSILGSSDTCQIPHATVGLY